MVTTLTSDQYEFIYYYYSLLLTIEEGFTYVVDSFTNLEFTEGDRVFKDILVAFYHLDSSHATLEALLNDDKEFIHEMKKFDQVIVTLDKEAFSFSPTHQEFVRQQLMPCYVTWKDAVQKHLHPYITH